MTLKHDIRPIIIHVLIPWNKVTLYCQIVPMCTLHLKLFPLFVRSFVGDLNHEWSSAPDKASVVRQRQSYPNKILNAMSYPIRSLGLE